jgi:D-alanine-D-alanine ligase
VRIRVGVFFGGQSVEHEVSIISALQAIPMFDADKYEVVPVYMARDGGMYVGEADIEAYRDIPALVARSRRVAPVSEGGRFRLYLWPPGGLARFFKGGRALEIDVAFPIVHGTNVEDGALQGWFKTMGVPFVGSGVVASAVGMDKYATKAMLKSAGIPALDCRLVLAKPFFADADAEMEALDSDFPVVVKPVNLGSSIGISVAGSRAELRDALSYAFRFTNSAIVERAVQPLREINCAVLGDRDGVEASECEEPIGSGALLSYEDKYVVKGGGKGKGSAELSAKGMGAAKRRLPADLSPDARETVRDLACRAFRALGCSGVARVDFLMDADGTAWVNEVNTIPGSLAYYLWEAVGMPFPVLLDRLVDLALKREREEASLSYSFETSILRGAHLASQ